MKKRMIKILAIAAVATCTLTGCQRAAKNFGGDMTLDLPAGQKLEEITWKDNSLWYLTKPMTEEDVAETYTFYESSEFGVWEGTVTIIEHEE